MIKYYVLKKYDVLIINKLNECLEWVTRDLVIYKKLPKINY